MFTVIVFNVIYPPPPPPQKKDSKLNMLLFVGTFDF